MNCNAIRTQGRCENKPVIIVYEKKGRTVNKKKKNKAEKRKRTQVQLKVDKVK